LIKLIKKIIDPLNMSKILGVDLTVVVPLVAMVTVPLVAMAVDLLVVTAVENAKIAIQGDAHAGRLKI
jgi:hypothetical protein